MISKNDVKYIQSLSHKKNRDANGVFIAEGSKLLNELLESDIVIQKIYASAEWASTHQHLRDVVIVQQYELEKLSNLSTPNQVLAIVEKKKHPAEPSLSNTITLVLDGIQDPGNLGTMLRIADWFGIYQVVAGIDTADVYNSKVIQSTMGSITRVDVWYKSLSQWLREVDVPIYGALLDGTDLNTIQPFKEGVIIIGNESKGIQDDVRSFIQHAVTIPKKGRAESLNAAVAAGIILSHLAK